MTILSEHISVIYNFHPIFLLFFSVFSYLSLLSVPLVPFKSINTLHLSLYITRTIIMQIVQADTYADDRTVQKSVAGKRLAVQLAGYKWLPGLQADELGIKFESLSAVSVT